MGNSCRKVSITQAATFKPQGGAGGLAAQIEKGLPCEDRYGKRQKLLEGRTTTCTHPHMHTLAEYFQVKLTAHLGTGNYTTAYTYK